MSLLPLAGTGVVIERMVPADAAALSRSHSDPDNARHQDWRYPLSEADARRFIDDQPSPGTLAPGTGIQLALRQIAGGPLAGDLYLQRCEETPTDVEIGITLSPGFHGRGLATAAVTALLDAFRGDGVAPPSLRRAVAIVDVDNDRSRALFERLGFRVEGRLEGDRLRRDGTPAEELVYVFPLGQADDATRLGGPGSGS